MNFFKKTISKADALVLSNEDFWNWFVKNERIFLVLCLTSFFLNCKQDLKTDKTFSSQFSVAERKYFIETAFNDDNKGLKWGKSILTYSIKGNFTELQIGFIKRTLSNLRSLSGVPRFNYTTANGDISFQMANTVSEFDSFNRSHQKFRGFTALKLSFFGGNLISANIHIKPSQSDINTLITIQHELMHALGLGNHPKSIFKASAALGIRYFYKLDEEISTSIPKLDSAALIILYNGKIPVKSNKEEISNMIGINNDPKH